MKKIILSSLDGYGCINTDNMVRMDRYKCTKMAPWVLSQSLWAEHPDALESMDAIPGDSGIVKYLKCTGYRCPNCNHRWYEYWKDV